jgi:pyruvate-formate lyase-activating enzyme
MNLRKLTPEDILPLISDYLMKAGLPTQAEELGEYYKPTKNHLNKYSLVKMIKYYISNKK